MRMYPPPTVRASGGHLWSAPTETASTGYSIERWIVDYPSECCCRGDGCSVAVAYSAHRSLSTPSKHL